MQRFVSVARTSSYKQKENTSQENQLRANKDLIDSVQGSLIAEFYDNESGTIFEREGLQKALELIETGQAEVLVYYDVSRMMRSDDVFLKTLDSVYNYKGKLAVATKGIIYPTLDEAMIQLFWDKNVAVYEHLQTKVRTRNGTKVALEKGGWRGRPPFGYSLKKQVLDGVRITVLEPDLIESDALNTFLDFLIQGVGKVESVKLTQKTYPQIYFNRSLFHRATKKLGKYVGKEPFELKYQEFSADYYAPPLISEDKYEKVRELKVLKRSKRNAKPVAYKGIVYCAKCGKTMCLRSRAGNRRDNLYSCASYVSYHQAKTYNNVHLMQKHKDYCKGMINQKKLNNAVHHLFHRGIEYDNILFSNLDGMFTETSEELTVNINRQDELIAKMEKIKAEKQTQIENISNLDIGMYPHILQAIEEKLKQLDLESKQTNNELKELRTNYNQLMDFAKVYSSESITDNLEILVEEVKKNNEGEDNEAKINQLLYKCGITIAANPETYQIRIGMVTKDVISMFMASKEGDRTLATSIQKIHSFARVSFLYAKDGKIHYG